MAICGNEFPERQELQRTIYPRRNSNEGKRSLAMLVLSRKKNERIMIGQDIEVTVVDIRGDRVKLGFVGPDNVPIHREEVYRRLAAEWEQEHACAAR
jgi:carbon storage regulator